MQTEKLHIAERLILVPRLPYTTATIKKHINEKKKKIAEKKIFFFFFHSHLYEHIIEVDVIYHTAIHTNEHIIIHGWNKSIDERWMIRSILTFSM